MSNSGDSNSGYSNSGNGNSGNWNSGYRNSGYRNSGDSNSGNWNSGKWNSGNWNSGNFCTGTPSPTFFDKPTSLTWEDANKIVPTIDLPCCCEWIPVAKMTDEEKASFPFYTTIGGFLRSSPIPIRESFPIAWAKLSDDEKKKWLALPNFDADKFFKITGVDVREPESPNELVVNGVRYVKAT